MGLMKELNELNALYQSQVYADVDEAMMLSKRSKGSDRSTPYRNRPEKGTVPSEVADMKVGKDPSVKPKGSRKGRFFNPTNEAYTVTNADKKGNTPAYQAYKAGKKNVKTGKPMYKAADHMKEGKINPGLQAYLDKKKGKKSDDNGNGKKNGSHGNGNGNGDNGNGNGGKGNGGNGKGGKPDFLDLDKDGNKKEPMKSAAKSAKKEETDYNYVNAYTEGMYGYNKGGMVKKSKAKPTVTINKPDKVVSMKVMTPKESFDRMIDSGRFSDQELQKIAEVTGILEELI